MKNKLLIGMIAIIVLITIVSAAIYTEPWMENQDGDQHNLTNMDWISARIFNGSLSGAVSGDSYVNWSYLTEYPAACPGSSAITLLNDTVTCSDLWFNIAGNETITGNMTFSNSGIYNISYIQVVGNSNLSGGNISLMDKISFRLLESIDNLIDGWITITGNLDVTGNVTANNYYAEMWSHNDTSYVTTVISTQNVWVNVSGFNSTTRAVRGVNLNGFTFDDVNENLVVLVAGKYRVDYSISTGNAGNNEEYQWMVAINDVLQENTDTHRKIGAAGDVGNTGGTGFIDLIVGDRVHLQTLDRDGTSDLHAHAANINLIRVGD